MNNVKIKLDAYEMRVLGTLLRQYSASMLAFKQVPTDCEGCLVQEVYEQRIDRFDPLKIKESNKLGLRMSECYAIRTFLLDMPAEGDALHAIRNIYQKLDKAIIDARHDFMYLLQ